jgi:hypothetical protein
MRFFLIDRVIKEEGLHTYKPLTLYSRRGSRGISDIPPRQSLPPFYKNYLTMKKNEQKFAIIIKLFS